MSASWVISSGRLAAAAAAASDCTTIRLIGLRTLPDSIFPQVKHCTQHIMTKGRSFLFLFDLFLVFGAARIGMMENTPFSFFFWMKCYFNLVSIYMMGRRYGVYFGIYCAAFVVTICVEGV